MDFARLDDFLKMTDAERDLPGSVCLVCRDGKELYRYAAGYADVESQRPMQMDTILRMYSMTKLITCTAALQLFEQGKYLMTDPLGDYLPQFRHAQVYEQMGDGEYTVRPAREPIRLRNLFTMTSGYGYPEADTPAGRELMKRFGGDALTAMPLHEFAEKIAEVPLLFDPDEEWRYGYSHDILGAFIETVSGMPFGEYVKKNILDPLGMEDTGFHLPEEKRARLASQYDFDPEQKTLTVRPASADPVFESGGGGIMSTVPDYMRFAEALCNLGTSPEGVRLLGAHTVRMMSANALNERQRRCFDWIHMKGYGYGYGVRVMLEPQTGGSNSSLSEFGWAGAAGTDVIIDPSERLTVVYGHQRFPNDEPFIHPRLRNIVYACL